jgi:hypothetical protein
MSKSRDKRRWILAALIVTGVSLWLGLLVNSFWDNDSVRLEWVAAAMAAFFAAGCTVGRWPGVVLAVVPVLVSVPFGAADIPAGDNPAAYDNFWVIERVAPVTLLLLAPSIAAGVLVAHSLRRTAREYRTDFTAESEGANSHKGAELRRERSHSGM